MALRVSSAFRTVSADGACVIARLIPLDLLAMERRDRFRTVDAQADPKHPAMDPEKTRGAEFSSYSVTR